MHAHPDGRSQDPDIAALGECQFFFGFIFKYFYNLFTFLLNFLFYHLSMDDQNIFDIDPTVFQDYNPELGFDPILGFSGQNYNILPDPELLARIRNWTPPPNASLLGRRTLPFGIVSAVREELAFAQSFFDGARAETVRAFRDPTRRAPRFRYWPDRSGLVPV